MPKSALALAALLAALALPSFAPAAAFEPNDSIPAAYGPLAAAQAYTAAIESPGDRDLYYFYVTSPRPIQVTLSFTNLGGGSEAAALNASIVDGLEAPVDSFAYAISAGGQASATVSLGPGKHYVKVDAVEGSAGSVNYSLATAGGGGAFGAYEQIASRCAKATASYKAAKARLQAAQGKLQRATARLRRARFASAGAKRGARAAYRAAKRRAGEEKRRLEGAGEGREPWCSIGR